MYYMLDTKTFRLTHFCFKGENILSIVFRILTICLSYITKWLFTQFYITLNYDDSYFIFLNGHVGKLEEQNIKV